MYKFQIYSYFINFRRDCCDILFWISIKFENLEWQDWKWATAIGRVMCVLARLARLAPVLIRVEPGRGTLLTSAEPGPGTARVSSLCHLKRGHRRLPTCTFYRDTKWLWCKNIEGENSSVRLWSFNMMTNNQHQIAISTGLAELAHTEYQVKRQKCVLRRIFKNFFRLVIMKMQRNIRCNFGDKTQLTPGFSFFLARYISSAGDMTSEFSATSRSCFPCLTIPGLLISPLWRSNRTRCWPRPTPTLATCSKSGASFRRLWITTDTPWGSSQTL